jgi:hypothetical protein
LTIANAQKEKSREYSLFTLEQHQRVLVIFDSFRRFFQL